MKVRYMPGFIVAALSLLFSSNAFATSITAIFGSGNPNNGWTASNISSNIQLGLRFKERTTGLTTNNGLGVYSMPTGMATPTRSNVQIEWSIFSDVDDAVGGLFDLTQYRFELAFDTDPSYGQSWLVVNPFAAFTDNSYGFGTTANGAGVEDNTPAGRTLAQNSFNTAFFPGFNPLLPAVLDVELRAYHLDPNYYPSPLAEVKARGLIGDYQQPKVPDTGSTLGLMALAVGAFGVARSRLGLGKNSSATAPMQLA